MAFKVATVIAALLFAFSAALQLNDPDPFRWIALYGWAAILSLLALRWQTVWGPASWAVVCVVSALLQVLVVGFPDEPHPMPMGPQTGWMADETVRELGGLALITIWMVVLAVRARDAQEASATEST